MPGTLATDSLVREYHRGVGLVQMRLVIDANTIERWREMGIYSVPILRDHGGWMPGVEHRWGKIENLRVHLDGGTKRVDGDWLFDPDLTVDAKGKPLISAIERGSLDSTSVGFDYSTIMLIEQRDDGLSVYETRDWWPREGSMVWAGADIQSKLNRSDNMDPEQLQQIIESAVETGIKRGLEHTRAPKPEPEPASTNEATFERVSGIAIEKLDKDTAQRLIRESGGSALVLGAMVRAEIATEPESPVRVPTVAGGEPGHQRASEALGAILLARGHQGNEEFEKAARQIDQDYQMRSTLYLLQQYAESIGVRSYGETKETFVRDLFAESRKRALESSGVEIRDGGRYYNKRGSGLVPADLPSTFQDVQRKALIGGYMRESLPLAQLARQRTATDFLEHKEVHVDLAAKFDPLAVDQQLHPIFAYDQEGSYRAFKYGHVHLIDYSAIVQDDLNALITIPGQLGELYAAGETREFVRVVSLPSAYSGGYVISNAAIDFKVNFIAVRTHADAQEPVTRPAGSDPNVDDNRTRALRPTVAIFPTSLYDDWWEYMTPENFDNRADRVRLPYLRNLFARSHETLYQPANTVNLWPGPETNFCPFVVARVAGHEMRVELRETVDPREQDGLWIRVQNSYAANRTHPGKYAYRVKTDSVSP